MRAREFIRELAAQGRYHFTIGDAFAAISGTPSAIRAQLRRLKHQRWIAEPVRSFHVIVPPEYMNLGCLPANQFIDQLMRVWDEPYYIALLSAAQRHGAAHQRPQIEQVMVRKNRQSIECGQIRIQFIARKNITEVPTMEFNTPRGILRYATPEVTALELVGYPNHAGNLSNVATVLSELAEVISTRRLVEAARLSPISWSQRLGYLLELVGQVKQVNTLARFVQENARSYTPLRRSVSTYEGQRLSRWKLIVNVKVEPDL